jgi:predicted dienelactone hydrolase
MDVPVLVQAGADDELTTLQDEVRPIYDGIGGTKHLLVIDGARHFSFTNICDIAEIIPDLPEEIAVVCDPEAPPIEDHLALVNEAALLFFDAYLRRDGDALARLVDGGFVGDRGTMVSDPPRR